MDTFSHDMTSLFAQLGLSTSPESMERFLATHSLDQNQNLAEAPCWTPAQAQFLREAIAEDADWAEAVDQLDARIRRNRL